MFPGYCCSGGRAVPALPDRAATPACLHAGNHRPEPLAVFSLVTEILYTISLRLHIPVQELHYPERGEAPTTHWDMQRGCPEQKGRLSLSASLRGSD